MIEPGTTSALQLAVEPQTRLLGVVAEYQDLRDSRWRSESPLPEAGVFSLFKRQQLTIHLGSRAVTISSAQQKGQ